MSDTPNASDNNAPIDKMEENKAPNNQVAEQATQQVETKQEISTKVDEVSEKSRRHFKYRSTKCLNCGQPLDLSDRYCPYCSQLNSTKQLSFGDFFTEFFSSLVSYDSRLWYTLKHLLFKPGTITKRYVEGHRLQYANPFRFFLSVSIIYFLVTGIINFVIGDNLGIAKNASGFEQYETPDEDIDFEFNEDYSAEDEKEMNDLLKGFSKDNDEKYISNPDWENEVAQAFGNDSTQIKNEVNKPNANNISEEREINKNLEIENDTTPSQSKEKTQNEVAKKTTPKFLSEEDLQKTDWIQRPFERFGTYNDFYDKTDITNAGRALDSLNHPPTRFNLWLYEKNNVIERISKDPDKFINYLSGKVPFFLFFFAPFFALSFWLIYSKKKYSYMEHLVFIFHIFSFIFLSLLIFKLPNTIFGTNIFTILLFAIIGPFYLYKALRNFYKQSRIITIIKFVFLNNVFLFSASIAAVFFFAITAATY